jgi:hypothetical protein
MFLGVDEELSVELEKSWFGPAFIGCFESRRACCPNGQNGVFFEAKSGL